MGRYTLAQVLEGRRALICAHETATVEEAVQIMLTERIAQLPVTAENGELRGVVSQQGILNMYFYANGQANLLRLPVTHCQDQATVLDVQDDLLKAIDLLRLRGIYAVVVTEQDKPVGILTGRDMTHFFRSLFEGMLLVEYIEAVLRECVGAALPDEAALRQALMATFGPSKQNRNLPARGQEHLSFTDMARLVSAPENWAAFESLLGPKTLFEPLMQRVRLVRNEVAHFQGRPDALELDTLHRAVSWLDNRRSVSRSARRRSTAHEMPEVRLHPLSEILAQPDPLLCVGEGATIGDALRLMTERRYAQLPVVDAANLLVGMVNQPTILSLYYFTKGDVPLLDLPIHHVIEPATVLADTDTLFRAVEALTSAGVAAAVVARERQPVGILTGKDMTHFFRVLFEGIILVERIELALRDHVSSAFPDEDALNAAAIAAFGPDPENPRYAIRNPHKLSFGDRLLMIADDDNWPQFEPILGPRTLFLHLMERVRQVRNELMHFSGRLDPLEREALMRADLWLQQRPPRAASQQAGSVA